MDATFDCGLCILRRWEPSDKTSLIRHANNKKVSRNLRDRFPYPYTDAHANAFLAAARDPNSRDFIYAIVVGGEAVGGIGVHPRKDVERHSAETGYWLGEDFWGRGIATAAVRKVSQRALCEPDIYRIFATVFASNPASARVLEKAGFMREGLMSRAVLKDGVLIDAALYAITRDPGLPRIQWGDRQS
ncbi:MAG: GNAT family N-acetyltransferase [Bryobacteraceae bacterium]